MRLPAFAVVAVYLYVSDRRAEGDALSVSHGEHGDFVVEINRPFDDDLPCLSSAPLLSSSSDEAKRYGEVGSFNFSAASFRMPCLSMVKCTARAVGITRQPCFSSFTSSSVAMASISGTM